MALSLNAGESYVINNVSPGETPAVNVITNPHALVVHNEEPGKVVLLGAEAGEWTVAVKTTDGSTVKYDVTVKSVGNVFDINHAAKAPATNRGHRCEHGYGSASSGQDGSGHRSGFIGVDFRIGHRLLTELTTTTDTVAVASSSASAPVAAPPGVPTSARRRSATRAFDFAPSVSGSFLRGTLRRLRVRRLRRHCRTSDFESILPSV